MPICTATSHVLAAHAYDTHQMAVHTLHRFCSAAALLFCVPPACQSHCSCCVHAQYAMQM